MPPSELTFTAPTSVDAVLAELGGDEVMLVGGGTSVALLLKNRFVDVERLVHLGKISELRGIHDDGAGELSIGATTTLREIARSPLIRANAPMLAAAAEHVGNPRIRAMATIGGAVVHGDPRQDLPPVLLALGARARVASATGSREIPFSELFLGFMETAVGTDELLTAVLIPDPTAHHGAYLRYCPGSSHDYPTVGVAASVSIGSDGVVVSARIAIAGVASTVLLADDAARILLGTAGDDRAVAAAADACARAVDPFDDNRGSASYKRAMTEVWVRRALVTCLAEPTRLLSAVD